MHTAALLFLGIAAFIVAALACLANGKRAGQRIEVKQAGQRVEVDLVGLRVAAFCFTMGRRLAGVTTATTDKEPTCDEKATSKAMNAIWMQWYRRCREQAIMHQKAMYSWARTLVLCATLCLVGVLLEVEFGEPITLDTIFPDFGRLHSTAMISHPSHSQPHHSKPVGASMSIR
jgi:hypothetical protein